MQTILEKSKKLESFKFNRGKTIASRVIEIDDSDIESSEEDSFGKQDESLQFPQIKAWGPDASFQAQKQ